MVRVLKVLRSTVFLLAVTALALGIGAGCGKHIKIHPGAINSADSAVYDTLLVSQAALEEGWKIVNENPSPEYISVYNKAAAIYNQAEADWQVYHSTGDGTLAIKLQQETNQVVQSVADMRKAFGKKVGK